MELLSKRQQDWASTHIPTSGNSSFPWSLRTRFKYPWYNTVVRLGGSGSVFGDGNELIVPEEELDETDVLGSGVEISVAALVIHLVVQSRRSRKEKGTHMSKLQGLGLESLRSSQYFEKLEQNRVFPSRIAFTVQEGAMLASGGKLTTNLWSPFTTIPMFQARSANQCNGNMTNVGAINNFLTESETHTIGESSCLAL